MDPERELEAAARDLDAALEKVRNAQRGGPLDLRAAREALDHAERRLRRARERLRQASDATARRSGAPEPRRDEKD